jgi:hypothetical protein
MTLNRRSSSNVLDIALIGRTDLRGTSEQEPINNSRRALIGGAIATLLASRVQVLADDQNAVPNDPFILLLHGLYQPVPAGHGPNLGLTTVNLNDGTYAVTDLPYFRGDSG